jgi:hypothetical protein
MTQPMTQPVAWSVSHGSLTGVVGHSCDPQYKKEFAENDWSVVE